MNKLMLSILTMCLGALLGFFVQQWSDRAKPSVQISSISFEKVSPTEIQLQIPLELQEMTSKSQWYKTLGSEISLQEAKDDLENDLSETVPALEGLVSLLPKLKDHLESNMEDLSVDAAKRHREFIASNSEPIVWTYLTMNVQALINRGEVDLAILEGADLEPMEDSRKQITLEEMLEQMNTMEEKAGALALQIVADWHPKDLLKTLDVVDDSLGEQSILNRKILEKMKNLIQDSSSSTSKDFLTLDVALSNNGARSLSFQKYSLLSLSGAEKPIFLEAVEGQGPINLSQGSAKEVKFRSREALEQSLSEQLRSIYNTNFIKCILTMRLNTDSMFSREWVTSSMASLSSFNPKLEALFIENSPVID